MIYTDENGKRYKDWNGAWSDGSLVIIPEVDDGVTDLATNSPNTNTELSNPQEQRIAEYKQLLNQVTELCGTFESEVLKKPHHIDELPELYKMRNEALDQCRAIILKKMEDLKK